MPIKATAIIAARLKPLQLLLADPSGLVYASMYLSSLSPVVLCLETREVSGGEKEEK